MKKIFSLGLAALMSASLVAAEPATLVWNGAAADSIWNTVSANWLPLLPTLWAQNNVPSLSTTQSTWLISCSIHLKTTP